MVGSDLYVAGSFLGIGGDPKANYLARWDGSGWSSVGKGPGGSATFNEPVLALAVSDGILYAGGKFTDAGGDPAADFVAKWDGESWSALGSDGSGNGAIPTSVSANVEALAVAGGYVYVGGVFHDAGGDPAADNIARWSSLGGWSAIGETSGDGAIQGGVTSILPTADGLYVGGGFRNSNNLAAADYLAFWNGSDWLALGEDASGDGWLNGAVYTLLKQGTDIYAGGNFLNIEWDPGANYVARWDGSQWHPVGNVTDETFDINGAVYDLAMVDGHLTAGGGFNAAQARYLASWDGTHWATLGPSDALDGRVLSMLVSGHNIYAGGQFMDAAGNPEADHVAVLTPSKPDARIRHGRRRVVGNDIYDATAADQEVDARSSAGNTIKFKVSAQNDGSYAERFRFSVAGSETSGFRVRYFHGTVDVTAAMEAGSYLSSKVSPGSKFEILVKVKITSNAATGSTVTRLVTVRSKNVPAVDAVRLSVKRSF